MAEENAENGHMRIEPAEDCGVQNVRSLWRNEPHWHTVWPEGSTWCYPTAQEAAARAVEVAELRALHGLDGLGERVDPQQIRADAIEELAIEAHLITEPHDSHEPEVTCPGCPHRTTGQTGEVVPLVEREAHAYREARRRLRLLHAELAGRRQDWANNGAQLCSSARAVAYQSAMQSVHSILDEIEAIAGGVR